MIFPSSLSLRVSYQPLHYSLVLNKFRLLLIYF